MRVVLLALCFLVFACHGSTPARAESADAAADSEAAKIEKLIAAVAGLKDAVVIRNGKEHSPAEAAAHMRSKWNASKSKITTARDFIRVAASVSSMSGKPYVIRWKDGKETTSALFLEAELARLEQP